jgi:hypothetical protein
MFGNNNQQDDQSNNTNMDQVAQEIDSQPTSTPSQFGLGTNPSSFSPTPNPTPLSTPPAPSDDNSTSENVAPAFHAAPQENSSSAPSGDLQEIKSKALEQLSPLVNKLDQSPEEKYKTLMMLIQSSDNHELIKEAYAAANSIEDEKVKAEALVNIINEINYFTQQSHS